MLLFFSILVKKSRTYNEVPETTRCNRAVAGYLSWTEGVPMRVEVLLANMAIGSVRQVVNAGESMYREMRDHDEKVVLNKKK